MLFQSPTKADPAEQCARCPLSPNDTPHVQVIYTRTLSYPIALLKSRDPTEEKAEPRRFAQDFSSPPGAHLTQYWVKLIGSRVTRVMDAAAEKIA